MNTRAFVLAILSPLSIGVVVIAHWWMSTQSGTDTDSTTDVASDARPATNEEIIVEAFNGPSQAEDAPSTDDDEAEPTATKCDSLSDQDGHAETVATPPTSSSSSEGISTDTDSCLPPTAAAATIEASTTRNAKLFATSSCQDKALAPSGKLIDQRPEEDACEPELECDAVSTKPDDRCDASTTVRVNAIALARRLVPPTTCTGRFEGEPSLPTAVTSSIQWYRYQALKSRFKAVAVDYIVNATASSRQAADSDSDSDSDDRQASTVNALIDAYKRLARCPSFTVEERALELEREQHNGPVNAAALRLVRLAVEVPEPVAGMTRPVEPTTAMKKLARRLDKANALELFRFTSEQQVDASFSTFQSVDVAELSLLELRALLQAFELSEVIAGAGEGTDAREWHRSLKAVVDRAKRQFETHRRRSLLGDGQCCMPHDTAMDHWRPCVFRRTLDAVLPLYAAQVKAVVTTKYVDAEVSTH